MRGVEGRLPERIGPYRVLAQLGSGGMGVVYEAAPEAGPPVAVKTVRVPRPSLLAAIRREIRALMRVRHPGVVRVLAEGLDHGVPWFAMELLAGGTLRQHHQAVWGRSRGPDSTHPTARKPASPAAPTVVERPQGGAPPREGLPQGDGARVAAGAGQLGAALRPVAELCQTLAFLHGEGLVHRDLKPDNVFLVPGRVPVLMDFGIAAQLGGEGRERLDAGAALAGTAGYMAPEQIHQLPIDARADLYAVGCLLYELTTGLSPFGGKTEDVIAHHVHSTPIAPSRLVDGCPPELERLILRLMSKDPGERLGHADDVVDVLEAWTGKVTPPRLDGAPARARPYLYRPELVGREDVRRRLAERLAAAADGAGAVIAVGGESGVGKTALATEAVREATRRGMTVVTAECVQPLAGAGVGGALHPFCAVLQAVADRCLERGAEATRRLLGARAAVLAAVEPTLARFAAGMPRPAELPAEAARQRLIGALGDTLAAFADERPLLVVLDDLQWADELSLAFLAGLEADWLVGRRLLLLATYRSDERSPSLERVLAAPAVDTVVLGRLDARTVEAMVGGMLALSAPPADIVDFVVRASEGNPFFVAEYLRAAAGEGLLARDPGGRWRLARPAGADGAALRLATPRGLAELVGQRLDALPPAARALAEVASVLGRESEIDTLFAAAGRGPAPEDGGDVAASHALSDLIARQVLEAHGGRVRFVHDKLREVAYDRLDAEARRRLHGGAARALEARLARPGRSQAEAARDYAPLAQHFELAGEPARAVEFLEKGGAHALATSLDGVAAELYARALELGRGLPGLDDRRRARWAHGLAKARFALGDLEAAETHARAALAQLGRPMPSTRGGWARLLGVEALRQTWRLFGPRRGDDELPAAARDDHTEAAELAALLTHRYYYIGDSSAMIGASLASVNLAERVDAGWRVARAYSWLGYVVGLLRRHELAARYFKLAHEGADRLGHPSERAFALTVEAVYHIGFAAWTRAEACAAEALALAGAAADVQMHEIALTVLGHIEFFTDRLDASHARYAEVLASARRRQNEQHTTWGLFSMARALVAAGRDAEALPMLREARARLERRRELDSEIICLGLIAQAELAAGERARAAEAAAETLARVRGSRPGGFAVIDGYDGAATALVALGDTAGARELVAAMKKLERLFPMAVPVTALHRGRLDAAGGQVRRARAALELARRRAGELGMPGVARRAATLPLT